MNVIFNIDPSKISTAQQKRFNRKAMVFFANKKVAAGMRAIRAAALPFVSAVRNEVGSGEPVRLAMTFFYAYPKSTPKRERVDDSPMPSGADCDNRAKAPIDALTQAGWWDDDRLITALILRKRRTTGSPRIEISVEKDS